MIPNRESDAARSNDALRIERPQEGEGNVAWWRRVGGPSGVLLVGGTSLVDFRLRFAQSGLRNDLTPSYWSSCGVLATEGTLLSVPLQSDDVSDVPRTNAVRYLSIEDMDDPLWWPNIAVLRFSSDDQAIQAQASSLADRRTVIDLPELLLAWLAYVWGAADADNPLLHSKGVPGAALVAAAHALVGIEVTPGLSSAASCPEAIWQAVKWWHEYYAETEQLGGGQPGRVVPTGICGVRQPSAAILLPDDPRLTVAP